jgi:hypothetical protein
LRFSRYRPHERIACKSCERTSLRLRSCAWSHHSPGTPQSS